MNTEGMPELSIGQAAQSRPERRGRVARRGRHCSFARKMRVNEYPAVLLVYKGRILNAWEGNFTGRLERMRSV